MKIKELEAMDSIFIYPTDIAELLKCNPQRIRDEARDGTFPFAYVRSGNTTKIYRKEFIRKYKELTT